MTVSTVHVVIDSAAVLVISIYNCTVECTCYVRVLSVRICFLLGVEEDFMAWWEGLKSRLLPVLTGRSPLSSLISGVQHNTKPEIDRDKVSVLFWVV